LGADVPLTVHVQLEAAETPVAVDEDLVEHRAGAVRHSLRREQVRVLGIGSDRCRQNRTESAQIELEQRDEIRGQDQIDRLPVLRFFGRYVQPSLDALLIWQREVGVLSSEPQGGLVMPAHWSATVQKVKDRD